MTAETSDRTTDPRTDRTRDVWGERTPHPRGTPWPTRVGLHLEDGLRLRAAAAERNRVA